MSTLRIEEPHLIVRVAGSRLALPIAVVARLEDLNQQALIDLGVFCELCEVPGSRATSIALHTDAGVVAAAIDAVEDVVNQVELQPLPAATRLRHAELVRGLVRVSGEATATDPHLAVVLDGSTLGDLIAEQVHAEEGRDGE